MVVGTPRRRVRGGFDECPGESRIDPDSIIKAQTLVQSGMTVAFDPRNIHPSPAGTILRSVGDVVRSSKGKFPDRHRHEGEILEDGTWLKLGR